MDTSLILTALLGTLAPAAMLATIGYKLWLMNSSIAMALIPTAVGYLGGWAVGILVGWMLVDGKNITVKGKTVPLFYYGWMSLIGAVVGAAIGAFGYN